MNTHVSIPVSTDTFLDLADFLREQGDPRDPVQMVTTAIRYWMENAEWKPELLEQTSAKGYQWKSLFLPDQTQIRMSYKGKYFYAKVEGDQFIWNGTPTTPAAFANAIAAQPDGRPGSRNAWRDLWIMRSDDKEWTLADDCRTRAARLLSKLEEGHEP